MNSARRTWQNLPLGSKLAALTSLLVIALVVALTGLSIERERTSFRTELEGQATVLLQTLPLTMRDQLYFLELDELVDIAGVIYDNETVTQVLVYDREGKLLVDAAAGDPVFSTTVDPMGASLLANARNTVHLDWQTDQLIAGRAIVLGNQPVGAVAVGLSTQLLNEKIVALTYQSILISFVILLVGIGFTILLARQITAPMSELTEVASKMASGDREARVKRTGEDELGQLGSAFNEMASSIAKREQDLRDLAAGLEMAVQQRTLELQEQNAELTRTNAELVIARREAVEATRLKSQFLAAMSHELRTPLNAIMGFSQLLMAGTSGTLPEKQQDKVERIFRNAETLLDMINDLLDLSKIEAGRTEIVNRPLVVRDWVKEIIEQLEGLATDKGLGFDVMIDEAMPHALEGDEMRLKQILTNLLSNAIKFTEEGKVSLEVKRDPAARWSIIVADTGVGIPSHAQEYIFDEFRQVDGSSKRKFGGTGLGLAIVRKLVVMMGGTIQVDSQVGKGSTFTVHLPLHEVEVTPVEER